MTTMANDNTRIYKAIEIEYNNGLRKCLDSRQMAIHMFLSGMNFARTNEMPEDDLEKFFNN